MEIQGDESGTECWRVRRELWPLQVGGGGGTGPDPVGGDDGSARAHLRGCEACRRWFRRDRRVGERIRGAGLAGRAPDALRLDLERRLSGTGEGGRGRSPGAPGRGWRRLAAAAVLVLAVAAGLVEQRSAAAATAGGLPDAMAADYVQRVEEELRLSVTDPAAIRSFFAEHYGMPLDPRIRPRAEIEGAMICWLRKRATAMVMYRIGGVSVAHYRARLEEGEDPSAGSLRTEGRAGVRLARWTSGGELHAVVADLPARDLSRLARARFGAGRR